MRIHKLQSARNACTRDAWETFTGHRDHVTELLRVAAFKEASSLCVLGAGNCNDLDLKELLQLYRQIQLVDLDAAALSAGFERQTVDGRNIQLLSDFDVTGVARRLSTWEPSTRTSNADIEACLAALATVPELPGEPFDVVLSDCLLSQLIDGIGATLGERHARFLEILTAVRRQHLRLLVEVVRPGGVAIVMTDIVSSDTCPALLDFPENDLPRVLTDAINSRNFFTGLNPMVLFQLFSDDDYLAQLVGNIRMAQPWRWNLGPRSYAVCAMLITRR